MSYIPPTETYGQSSVQAEPLNLGPNIFPAQPGQLPPEAYQSQTPTVRTLPPKVVKNTLPPKVVTTRLQPIFPPGTAPTSIPQF